jgi:hypothetical protein
MTFVPPGFFIRFLSQAAYRLRARPGNRAGASKGGETMKRRSFLAGIGATTAAATIGMPSILRAQAPITLNGAVQFNDDHAFNRALIRFEELVKKYYGKPVNFTLHKNSSLGSVPG